MSDENKLAEENQRLHQENEGLRLQHNLRQSENEALRTQLQELELIRRNLEHTIGVYKRCLFGSRSEKIDPKELEARIAKAAAEAREQLAKEKRPGDPPPEAEEEQPEEKADPSSDKSEDPEKEKKRKARPHGRGGFPGHLPRRRIEHPVDPAKAVCACCADHPPLIWAYGLPWAEVVFDFRTDKSHKGPLEFLKGTTARFVQADGGSSYSPVFDES